MTDQTTLFDPDPEPTRRTSVDPEQGDARPRKRRPNPSERSIERTRRRLETEEAYRVVRDAIREDPEVSVEELYRLARGADPDIGKLTLRQFNARIPLQIKRVMKKDGEL